LLGLLTSFRFPTLFLVLKCVLGDTVGVRLCVLTISASVGDPGATMVEKLGGGEPDVVPLLLRVSLSVVDRRIKLGDAFGRALAEGGLEPGSGAPLSLKGSRHVLLFLNELFGENREKSIGFEFFLSLGLSGAESMPNYAKRIRLSL